jgi:hypothetical protein
MWQFQTLFNFIFFKKIIEINLNILIESILSNW